ncbi:hypothetical protein [Streptomyces bungoensis]|uniref:hypothetical protein n=1 Tax=Streptomyces bungoensis TaxID=285568 RepID=UPI00344625C7
MTRAVRIPLFAVALALLVGFSAWYRARSVDAELPGSLCGTTVSPDLSRLILRPDGKVTEHNGVDRRRPRPSSWCQVIVDGRSALSFRFAWHPDAVDPYEIAQSHDSVSSIEQPTRLNAAYQAAVGNNGAVATTDCETDVGDYFTLTVLLEGTNPVDRSRRKDMERFLRAYFPATVKTLNCA